MIRFVRGFWNEVAQDWAFECYVKIVSDNYISQLDTYLGQVEYTDGTYLDIYNHCGILVGVEWNGWE